MIFDDLIGQANSELDLARTVAARIHETFRQQNGRAYVLKLERVDETKSKIVWVKEFASGHDFKEYHFALEFMQASIHVFQARDLAYDVSMVGYIERTDFIVYEDQIKPSRFVFKVTGNIESCRYPPRELLEAAYADLSKQFRVKAKRAC